ncbi:hypothetical protein THASP1DRAFT_32944 [Thamnocephalis sphaerospora]|uniref:Uncharacterized protein n=1 Tax=Thamnocephalis sphaerospora TaxID=78915 RepID=A0A4P9XHW1_9FUNG|nr:hypothetical protein THASP1DRAFT_32944 [Thamnocephalis sphaerospora]|eukprot:RKP05216.1 hypothetical protein THASP1DRAFT_32944 [Thamnocephalis sphaerospora]
MSGFYQYRLNSPSSPRSPPGRSKRDTPYEDGPFFSVRQRSSSLWQTKTANNVAAFRLPSPAGSDQAYTPMHHVPTTEVSMQNALPPTPPACAKMLPTLPPSTDATRAVLEQLIQAAAGGDLGLANTLHHLVTLEAVQPSTFAHCIAALSDDQLALLIQFYNQLPSLLTAAVDVQSL